MSAKQTPSRSLPVNASAEFLRKEAKRLARQGGMSLGITQRQLAHDYGYRNWADLIAAANIILQPASAGTGSDQPLRDEEWSEIRDLGEASLAEMPMVPTVKEWLDNRRSFRESKGVQRQFVATSGKRIVGYACAEHPPAWMRNRDRAAAQYRLFMVVEPALRATLGTRLLERLRELLIEQKARRAWFQEYEADTGFISFLEGRGFARASSFQIEDGTRIVRLFIDAPFAPMARRSPTDLRTTGLHQEESR